MFDIVNASGSYYESEDDNFAGMEEEIVAPTPSYEEQPIGEDSPQEQEVDNEEIIEIDPFDRAFYTPGTFENSEQELEWYRDRIDSINQMLDGDSELYKMYAAEQAQAMLEKTAADFEGFKEMHQALHTDAKRFFLQYIPEALAEHGVNPIMDTDQLMDRVNSDLQKEFGDDYRHRLNQAELFDPMSFTAKVWARQQGLVREWDGINARNKELMAHWNESIANQPQQQQTPTGPTQEDLHTAFEQHFAPKGYNEEQFNYIIEQASSRQLGFEDIEKLVRFDDYVQEAYNLGREEALKGRYNEARKEGQEYRVPQQQTQFASQNSIHEEFLRAFQDGGVPYY